MKDVRLIVSCLALFITFPACNKDCGSPPPVPAISYDFPVTEGDYLVLTARGSDDLIYSWIGPDNSEYVGKIWEVGTVQRRNSGNYVVTAKEGDCDGITNVENVEVLSRSLPCVPAQQSMVIDGSSINTLTNTAVSCGKDAYGNFIISLEGDEGVLMVHFAEGESPLFPRSYGIKGNPDFAPEDVVEVAFTTYSDSTTFKARNSGYFFIRYTSSNVFEFYLCDLPLYNESTTINITLRNQCIL